jgi:CTP synthase
MFIIEQIFFQFVGTDTEKQRMEIVELKDHPYFVAVQYHPEYLSRPLRPSPPYLGLVLAATGKLQSFLAKVKLNSDLKNNFC